MMAAVGIFGIDDSRYYSAAYFLSVVPMTAWIGAVAFFPALVAIVLGEAFSWRSALYYLAVGGAVGLIADQIANVYGRFDLAERQTVILLAAGFVGGFTYWLIAGRLAGIRRPDDPMSDAT